MTFVSAISILIHNSSVLSPGNINPLLDFFNQRVSNYIFNKYAVFLYLLISIMGFIVFLLQASNMLAYLKHCHHVIEVYSIAYVLFLFTIPLHELAHATMVKFYGRNVGNVGVGWLWITLVSYVDTTSMSFADRKSRFIVNIAGIFFNLVIGSLAMLICLIAGNNEAGLILFTFALFNYLSCILNLNPYLEFDGYYLLVDMLDCQNLKSRAIHWLINYSKSTFTQSKKIIQFKNEIIYWLACICYMVVSFILIYMIQNYVISIFFPHQQISYLAAIARYALPATLIILSFYSAFFTYKN